MPHDGSLDIDAVNPADAGQLHGAYILRGKSLQLDPYIPDQPVAKILRIGERISQRARVHAGKDAEIPDRWGRPFAAGLGRIHQHSVAAQSQAALFSSLLNIALNQPTSSIRPSGSGCRGSKPRSERARVVSRTRLVRFMTPSPSGRRGASGQSVSHTM